MSSGWKFPRIPSLGSFRHHRQYSYSEVDDVVEEKESRLRQQLKHSHQSTQDLEASLLASRHGQRKEDRERIESLEAQLHDKDREVMRLRKSLFFLMFKLIFFFFNR